jgi:hypothetical protein
VTRDSPMRSPVMEERSGQGEKGAPEVFLSEA